MAVIPEDEAEVTAELQDILHAIPDPLHALLTDDLSALWPRVQTCVKKLQIIRSNRTKSSSDTPGSATTAPSATYHRPGPVLVPVPSLVKINDGGSSATGVEIPPDDLYRTRADILLDLIEPMFQRSWSQSGPISQQMYPVYLRLVRTMIQMREALTSGLFTQDDINRFEGNLLDFQRKIEAIQILVKSWLERSAEIASGTSTPLMHQQLASCTHRRASNFVAAMSQELSALDPALRPLHTRLVELRRELDTLALRATQGPHAVSLLEIQVLQDAIREIDALRVDGAFRSKEGLRYALQGQGILRGILEDCFEMTHELLAARDTVTSANPLRETYEELIRLRAQLHAWVAQDGVKPASDALIQIQRSLGEIDNKRTDGKFMDSDGTIPEGQAVLHQLLHGCYRLVHRLQVQEDEPSSETLDPSLVTIHQQLQTLHKCMDELQRWAISLTPSEQVPYRLKLRAITTRCGRDPETDHFLNEEGLVPKDGQEMLIRLYKQCEALLDSLAESDDEFIEHEVSSVADRNASDADVALCQDRGSVDFSSHTGQMSPGLPLPSRC
ncbi:hypothetical protein CXG81DRAFT_15916 [Caulochytrium protostelioides]|uniref:Uncharacterized protein n=1 Tax=Caulochytrium protostelioides TaxID=1555241 RepID=A0A4P9WUT9_9FUNG|nr:hypothetical protein CAUPRSCDRAFT_7091 [Caulochytrium protostelioides]RKO98448.1 hypothetical protein CXG81DRAFT_15916 [Caulochytrium protostelioides]|eukprot:RKO98448.1 hypothetical protein CXG81DRAFT_15916 [Caulochytrium protostelioides]